MKNKKHNFESATAQWHFFYKHHYMKYRKLTDEELEELKEEFIQFLVSNTITADDWVKIKEEENEKAKKLIELFSDQVMDKALTNINFLEHREPKNLMLFHCGKEVIDMIGLTIDSSSVYDFTNDNNNLTEIAKNDKISIFKKTKKYTKNREEEIFDMLNNGCLTTNEKLYKVLANLK